MGFLFGSGGSAKTDRNNILDTYGRLDDASTTGMDEGFGATGDALGYFKSILSGNPTAQAAAVAPEVNAASGQQEQQRQQLSSEGTSRGGGINAAEQQGADLVPKTTVDTLTALAPKAASSEAAIGGNLAALGTQAAADKGYLALHSRAQNLAQRNALFNQLFQIAGSLLTAGAGGVPSVPAGGGGAPPIPTGAGGTGTTGLPIDF